MKNWIIAGLCFLIAAPAAAALSPVFEIEQLTTGGGPCSGAGLHIQVGSTNYYACSGTPSVKTVNASGATVSNVIPLYLLGQVQYRYWDGSTFWAVDPGTGQPITPPGTGGAVFADSSCATTPFVGADAPNEVKAFGIGTAPYAYRYPSGPSSYDPSNTSTCYTNDSGPCRVDTCPASAKWLSLSSAGSIPTISGSAAPLQMRL
jgi:hypothetical protein